MRIGSIESIDESKSSIDVTASILKYGFNMRKCGPESRDITREWCEDSGISSIGDDRMFPRDERHTTHHDRASEVETTPTRSIPSIMDIFDRHRERVIDNPECLL